MVYLSVFIRMVSGYEQEKLYAVFLWKSMDQIEKHTKSKYWEGVCQKNGGVFELDRFKKCRIRECHHVREFLHELVFGSLWDEKVLSLQSAVGYLHRCGYWQYPAGSFANVNRGRKKNGK